MHYLYNFRSYDCVRLLLDARADVNHQGENNFYIRIQNK